MAFGSTEMRTSRAVAIGMEIQREIVRVREAGPRIPRPLTPADIRRLGDSIRALAHGRKGSLHYYLEVGGRVFEELYGRNLAALRSESFNVEGEPSFNEIARELSGTITKTTLHRAVWAYQVRETTPVYRLREGMDGTAVPTLEQVTPDQLDRLGVSHLYEAHILETELRSELLSRAVHEGWSVRRLRYEIELRTGRLPRPPLAGILQLLRDFGEVPSTVDLAPLTALSRRDARHYRAIADKLHDLARRAQQALAKHDPAKGSV